MMRNLINLIESAEQGGEFYLHVSPLENLRSIMSKGLLPNVNGGNYSGFEASLDGTYVTKNTKIIRDHIYAREIDNGYVLVVVHVANGYGVIDEDAMHDIFLEATDKVLKPLGLDYNTAMEKFEPDDDIWKSIAPVFQKMLGPANQEVLNKNPGIVEEFTESVIREVLYGEDGDPSWWEHAKTVMVDAFPNISHPVLGDRYSIRIPGPIGFKGSTRIIGVIAVENSEMKVVKGELPYGARRLVDQVIDGTT